MSLPLPFRKRAPRHQVRQDWVDERLREARIVVADVANHSDHLIRLACDVLVQHGETPGERADAQRLLVVVDARRPVRRAQREDQGRAAR